MSIHAFRGGASVTQPEPQRETLPLSEAVTADIRHLVDQFSPNWAEFHTVAPVARLELP